MLKGWICAHVALNAMGLLNFRIVTIIAALFTSILSATSLLFLVTSLIKYRAEDFFTASETTDFTSLGTCVETLTLEQLDELKYGKVDTACRDDDGEDSVDLSNLINTVRATVHGAYYAYTTNNSNTTDDYLETVISAMAAHVLKKEPDTPPKLVSFSAVYKALKLVSEIDVPVSCNAIYNLSSLHIADSKYTSYIANIREGRLDDDEKIKSTWPLAVIAANCVKASNSSGGNVSSSEPESSSSESSSNETSSFELTPDDLKFMYAHCIAQFEFASVAGLSDGTQTLTGTYGIPMPGIKSGPPGTYPYPQADGFNSTSSYSTRARMYLGQRFGLSIWAYVPMILASCYLLGDSVAFFFAESYMPNVLAAQAAWAKDRKELERRRLVISATTSSARTARFMVGLLAVIVSIGFYAFWVVLPWGFSNTSLPRPICEQDGLFGAMPDHVAPQMGWKGTKGGWKADYDATWYEHAALILQLVVLALLQITTWEFFDCFNSCFNKPKETSEFRKRIVTKLNVPPSNAYSLQRKVLFPLLVLSTIGIIVGQTISGARFGMAWADGVVAQEVNAEDTLIFDEVTLSKHVYDQTVATLAAVVSCGLIIAVAMQRHLLSGKGPLSTVLFFGWVTLVVIFGLPLFIFSANRSIFEEPKSIEDCAIFPRTSHEFENDLCIIRFWSFLGAAGTFAGTIGVIMFFGFIDAFRSALTVSETEQVKSESSFFSGKRFATNVPSSASAETAHFFVSNVKHKGSKSANEFLYGRSMAVLPARR